MNQWPEWIRPGVRAWHRQHKCVIERAGDDGVVLARYARRRNPCRRLLTPAEAARALEFGDLRPDE